MHLSQLKLVNFKNYEEIDIDFHPRVNCLIGNNGMGKTNILDAIYYLSFCKSYLNFSDSQNIRHQQEYFAIHGVYFLDAPENNISISCVFKPVSGKTIFYNKKKYTRFSEHIGRIPLVIISPGDQDMISEGSDVRRKFLDGIISQVDNQYLELLINYQKVLEQRNRLLKDFSENRYTDDASLQIWDEQLIRFGEPIYEKRTYFLKDFSMLFQHFYKQVSVSPDEMVDVKYESHLKNKNFAELLLQNRTRDIQLQFSSVGIHKDDLFFSLNNYPMKKIGSQGQQKTFSLSLKLANFQYIKKNKEITPLLLLDDIFDKLDAKRVKQIIKIIGDEHFGQVFITDTQQERLKKLFEEEAVACRIFNVSDNQLQPE